MVFGAGNRKKPKRPPKPWQTIAADGLLRKKDVIVKTPTSTGKGQVIEYAALALSALSEKGTMVIVEPLRALLTELSDRFGDQATYVDGTHRDGALMNDVLMDNRLRKHASAIVFDEAHTLDQWSHDFRPKFMLLGEVRKHLDVPVMLMRQGTTPSMAAVATWPEVFDYQNICHNTKPLAPV
ncbi:hypothetical protein V8E36_005938 [Tilletia maclaganii]